MNTAKAGDGSGKTAARLVMAAATLLFAAVLLPAASTVLAQTPEQIDKAEEYVQQTGEILMRVRDIVDESESARARRVLAEAKKAYESSRELLARERLVMAVQLSQRAREGARQAERLARVDLASGERVRLRLDRLQELYEAVRERAVESGDEQALRFVREAERQYANAREQFAQTNFEIALNLLKSCETLLQRAARLVFEQGDRQRLESDLDRTEELVARARDQLDPGADRGQADLLARAEDNLGRARAALARGAPLIAMEHARRARGLARRALGEGTPLPQPEAVRDQIDRWEQRREAVAAAVAESDSEPAVRALRRAENQRDQAERALRDGDVEGALRLLRAAHDSLARAEDALH